MDLELLLGALLLGVVEGLTEFIPVSSTGHLILVVDLIGFRGPPGQVFEVVIQLGAIVAVCWDYRGRFPRVAAGLLHDPDQVRFVRNILVALHPGGGDRRACLRLHQGLAVQPLGGGDYAGPGRLRHPPDRAHPPEPRHHAVEQLPAATALQIGLCQAVAMIPGVSRVGRHDHGRPAARRRPPHRDRVLVLPGGADDAGRVVYDLYKNWALMSADSSP